MRVTTNIPALDGVTSFPEGVQAPNHVTVRATGNDLPCDVDLDLVLEGGRMRVRSVSCLARGKKSVTTEALRAVPVRRIFDEAMADVFSQKAFAPALKQVREQFGERPEAMTDEALRQVATAYRLAWLTGDPPTQAVATAFGFPRSTAGRWISEARRRRILGRANPRQGGER